MNESYISSVDMGCVIIPNMTWTANATYYEIFYTCVLTSLFLSICFTMCMCVFGGAIRMNLF